MAKKTIDLPRLPNEDLEAMLGAAISRANAPVTVPAAIKALPAGKKPKKEQVQTCLNKLVAAGLIHPWAGSKYWSVNPEAFAREQVLQALTSGPLAETEIKNKVASCAKTLVKTVLAALVKEGTVIPHPKLGTKKPFGKGPPDAMDYLPAEIEAVFAKLTKLGFKKAELQRTLRRYVGDPYKDDGVRAEGNETILAAMARLNSQLNRGALVYLADLRAALTQQFRDKDSFDSAVLELAKQGRVQLQSHAWPGRLSDQEKDALVPNGRGGFFDAIGLRLE